MKVLFIGGTGTISTACTALAAQRGIDLYLLNRGQRQADVPPGVKTLRGDIRQPKTVEDALGDHTFDAVVDWIAFTPEHVETDLRLFKGKCGQFVFISSASAYQKPVTHYLITESTPLANPFWEYSRNKIACEELLIRAHRDHGFPVTIVRPSHTYGDTSIPLALGGGWTECDRILRGKPVVVHGDGQSLWVLTHNSDFAKAFVPLLGMSQSIGHAFHITSDQALTWNQIYAILGDALGAEPKIVHIPSDFIVRVDPGRAGPLHGDKACSVVFDNSKIKRFVPEFVCTTPFERGIRKTIAWYRADPSRQKVDEKQNAWMDDLITRYGHG